MLTNCITCKQVPAGELKVSANASTPPSMPGDIGTTESIVANGASARATEDSIVSGLIGTDETRPARNNGEASVPSAEEGLNLWESAGNVREATDTISMQVMELVLRALPLFFYSCSCNENSWMCHFWSCGSAVPRFCIGGCLAMLCF